MKLQKLKALLKQLDGESNSSVTAEEARRRLSLAEAKLAELRLAEREGQLVNAEEVRLAVSGMILNCRNVLLRIPSEVRDRLAGMTDPVQCGELLDSEIRRALTALSEYRPKPKRTKTQGQEKCRA